MSFDEDLADRVREALAGNRPIEEKLEAGGLYFVVRGSTACGIRGEELFVRMDPEWLERALERPGASLTDATGRTMSGMLFVRKAGTRARPRLERWIKDAVAYAATLPAKRSS